MAMTVKRSERPDFSSLALYSFAMRVSSGDMWDKRWREPNRSAQSEVKQM